MYVLTRLVNVGHGEWAMGRASIEEPVKGQFIINYEEHWRDAPVSDVNRRTVDMTNARSIALRAVYRHAKRIGKEKARTGEWTSGVKAKFNDKTKQVARDYNSFD